MSLLADLLSRVTPGKTGGSIPPTLRSAVRDSQEKRTRRKSLVLLGSLSAAFVLAGIVAVHMSDRNKVSLLSSTRDGNRTNPVLQSTPELVHERAETSPSKKASETDGDSSGGAARQIGSFAPRAGASSRETGLPQGSPNILVAKASDEARAQTTQGGSTVTNSNRAQLDEILYAAKSNEAAGDYEGALSRYRRAAELDPQNYIVMNEIARVLIAKGAYKESAEYARSSLNLRGQYVPALVNLGICSVQTGDLSGGIAFLKKALSLEPTNKYALQNLGLTYEKGKDYEEARGAYSKLAKLGDSGGYLGLARVAEVTGKTDDARTLYRTLLGLDTADDASKKVASDRLKLLER